METNGYHVYQLDAKTIESLGSTAEYHFRYAESQFLPLAAGQPYHVTRVDYVGNPPSVKAFEANKKRLSPAPGPREGGSTNFGFPGAKTERSGQLF